MIIMITAPARATSSSALNSVPAVADHVPQALVHHSHHDGDNDDQDGDVDDTDGDVDDTDDHSSPCAG